MRIKKRLQLNAAISVLTALIIFFVLVTALYRINEANESSKIAGEIITNAFERVTLRNDYMRNNNARAKEQWFAKQEQIGELLKSASEFFRNAEDKANIAELVENHESIGSIFSAIVVNREKKDPDAAGLSREVEERLLNQLNMRNYKEVVLGRELRESSKEARASALSQAGLGIISVLFVLILAAIINARTMGRAITERAQRLREGALLIGGGDLEHRIDMRGDDEFAEVSETFNAMTAKLSGSYRNLEEEIKERKQAEEELHASRNRLEAALEVAGMGFYQYGEDFRVISFDSEAREILGIDDLSNPHQVWQERIHADDQARLLEIAQGIEERNSDRQTAEYRYHHPRKGVIWIRHSVRVLKHGPDGNMTTQVGVVQDITERKRAEEELQKAHNELAMQMEERVRELREKEVLLKEIHHRVKNNLQVISSLVGLQAEGSQDQSVREGFRDVAYRVRSMALVHEKLYQSASLSRIDFAEYARSLLNYLWRAHGAAAESIGLKLDLEPVSLPVDTAVPGGLILNELAGNALKHAFRGRSEGEVTVSLRGPEEGRISLCVSDNGVGLPAEFDWRQSGSLGLRLVQMLAGQLHATVEVSGESGTRFEIRFKLPE